MSEDKLTKDDLVLLMESYRNMITMHQTILDQTNKTIDKLDTIATKQDSLFSKQGSICNSIGSVSGKVDTNIIQTKNTGDSVNDLKGKVIDKINTHEKKSIEDHGKLANKIHLGWVGMGTIILGLLGLIVTITNMLHTHQVPIP